MDVSRLLCLDSMKLSFSKEYTTAQIEGTETLKSAVLYNAT